MKKWISLFLVAVLGLMMCACGGTETPEQTAPQAGLQIGFAREAVMPRTGTPVLDGTSNGRYMTGYTDELSVTCIAVRGENEETVLLYSMDKLTSDEEWTAPVRAEVSEVTGIAQDHIMLAATHTHSAPLFSGWEGSAEYKAQFQEAMNKAGQDALADLTAARMSFGYCQTENLVYVRQYRLIDGTVSSNVASGDASILGHAAENDPQLQVVRFTREGKKDVVLMSFNAHPTFYGGITATNMSADYPAPTRDYIESKGDYLVAFFLGDGGNQAPNTKYKPEMAAAARDYREYGQRLGQYVLDLLPELTESRGAEVKLSSLQYQGKTNKAKVDQVADAQKVMDVYRAQGWDAAEALAAQYGMYQYLEANAIIKRSKSPDTNEVLLKVMAIGDQLSFAFAPYEMFSENGSRLRAETPYDMTFLVTCCNGREGYLPSQAACDYGCYELYTTMLEPGTAEILIEEFLGMLTALKG